MLKLLPVRIHLFGIRIIGRKSLHAPFAHPVLIKLNPPGRIAVPDVGNNISVKRVVIPSGIEPHLIALLLAGGAVVPCNLIAVGNKDTVSLRSTVGAKRTLPPGPRESRQIVFKDFVVYLLVGGGMGMAGDYMRLIW